MRKVKTFERRWIENVVDKSTTHEVTALRLRTAIVYYHADWEEYCVRFYIDGTHQTLADYMTDDKDDAISTADYFVNRGI
jgi:hypothetical protein